MMKSKTRKCFVCKTKLEVELMHVDKLKAVCRTPMCMGAYGLWKIAKINKDKDRAYNAETKVIKAKYGGDARALTGDIQRRIFNPWVKLRDKADPCISCGKTYIPDGKKKIPLPPVGKSLWEAGHYKSIGARKDVRFHPDNCHKQCFFCNNGAVKNSANESTVTAKYRINLIKKIGLARVEALEVVKIRKYTVDELELIKKEYSIKLKALKAAQ